MPDADFAYQPPHRANAYGPQTSPADDTGGAPVFSSDFDREPDRKEADKFVRDRAARGK